MHKLRKTKAQLWTVNMFLCNAGSNEQPAKFLFVGCICDILDFVARIALSAKCEKASTVIFPLVKYTIYGLRQMPIGLGEGIHLL